MGVTFGFSPLPPDRRLCQGFLGRTLVGKELSQELEVEKDVTTDPRSARPTETDTKKRKR